MNPINAQGSVPLTGGIMYTPPNKYIGEVTNIKINNTAGTPFTVAVSRFMAFTKSRVILYSLTLGAGEAVDDTTVYNLKQGDYLYLIPSQTTISYVITGLESQIV